MEYAADTVTIVRHFTNTGKIGRKARGVLEGVESGEHHIFVSVISLVEVMYLSQKQRIDINLDKTMDIINSSSNYSIVNLTPEIVKIAEKIEHPELHDKLIIATAKYLNIPLLTNDKPIRELDEVETVWNN